MPDNDLVYDLEYFMCTLENNACSLIQIKVKNNKTGKTLLK